MAAAAGKGVRHPGGGRTDDDAGRGGSGAVHPASSTAVLHRARAPFIAALACRA
ncbi:hypothetical protein L288_16870 [Sphingobium quisquiliarum P25]|uniref:Uncharacterized protein n=1 Tax=Sphingobium quisquiliarum P25 TaxID=1329909 RepID=T0GQG5_9SPHN|nr:hypothetical protein L288_16870 [Sphingobium quisquiliarum P25]